MDYSIISHSFKVLKFQNSKVSKFQSPKVSKFQSAKVPRFQDSKISKFQRFKVSKSQNFKFSNLQIPSFWKHGTHISPHIVFRLSDFPESYVCQMNWYFIMCVEVILHKIRESKSSN